MPSSITYGVNFDNLNFSHKYPNNSSSLRAESNGTSSTGKDKDSEREKKILFDDAYCLKKFGLDIPLIIKTNEFF